MQKKLGHRGSLLTVVVMAATAFLVLIQSFGGISQPQLLLGLQEDQAPRSKTVQPYHYGPSPIEQYFIDNAETLGLRSEQSTPTCPLIKDETLPIHKPVQRYFQELEEYNRIMKEFQPIEHDLRDDILPGESNIEQVCSAVKIHRNGLEGIFNSNGTSSSTHAGVMEPLLPVMRNQKICPDIGQVSYKIVLKFITQNLSNQLHIQPFVSQHLMSLEYLVHDFYSMCKQLKRHSRTVFIDMGASLDFHGSDESPAIYIIKIYSKFGFQFDHIYAYEINQMEPARVYERVPNELMTSYHWINVGK